MPLVGTSNSKKVLSKRAQNLCSDNLVLITKRQENERRLVLKLLPFVDHYGLFDFNEYIPTADSKRNQKESTKFHSFVFNFHQTNEKEQRNCEKPVKLPVYKRKFFFRDIEKKIIFLFIRVNVHFVNN